MLLILTIQKPVENIDEAKQATELIRNRLQGHIDVELEAHTRESVTDLLNGEPT